MNPELHECPKSHLDFDGNIVFTWAFKFDTTNNELDGFSLMNMKESDIFLMIPGKVGPARKMCTLIDNIKRNKEKCEQKIEGYRIIEYKEDSAGC